MTEWIAELLQCFQESIIPPIQYSIPYSLARRDFPAYNLPP